MSALKVLLVGPCITRAKGGIATVLNNILEHEYKSSSIKIRHIVSYVEGSSIEKIWVALKALISVLTHKSYDVMHIHVASDISIFRKSLFVFLSLARNKPIIMHVHGGDFDVYYHKSSPLIKMYIRKTFSKCNKIIVLSDYWKVFFDDHFQNENVEVLHNGVQVNELKRLCTAPLNLTRFLFLGKITKAKGVYDLLAVIDILVNQLKQRDLIFFLAGDGDTEQVEDIIKRKGLSGNVRLLGWINEEEKVEWLQQVDTVLLPSYIEGLPMSIIEAMAAGKVVISSRIGGIPDLVKEENGFLITPGDIDKLTTYIQYVRSNPEQMINMSKCNSIKISEHYNVDEINKRLFQIYYDVAGKKNQPKQLASALYHLGTYSSG